MFGLAVVLGLVVLELGLVRPQPEDLTQLALRQLDGSDAAEELRTADAAKNWRLLAWPVGLLLLAGVLFWEEIEGWWQKSQAKA
jgi:hypothetical protein